MRHLLFLTALIFHGCTSILSIKIGNQVWMKKNLDVKVAQSWCYNDSMNCEKFGRLYTWHAAMNACPSGWRLPTDDDWKIMERSLGMPLPELNKNGWRGTIEGDMLKLNGSSGFNDPLAGYMEFVYGKYAFVHRGSSADYWTATETHPDSAYARGLSSDNSAITRYVNYKKEGFSIRCIKVK